MVSVLASAGHKNGRRAKNLETQYTIEMLNITKRFPGIIANDNITLKLKKGEIHALLGENGAGKSTLMSVLFGLYQPEEGEIHKDGRKVEIRDPNDANALGIGMVHQHFKLVECFSVLDNIILGVEPNKMGFLQKQEARKKVIDLSEKYGLHVDPDAIIEDITVGMQQRTEILKMLYRDNEILIFDEPTAVLTPQEIEELMQIMKNLAAEGKSILFISHKLNEIMEVSDRVTVLRKGKCIGTVETAHTTAEDLSAMMVGRNVNFHVEKGPLHTGSEVLSVEHLTVASKVHKNSAVKDVSFKVRAGEIVCIAGIDGNGQTELVYALTGLEPAAGGRITLEGKDITHATIRQRSLMGMSHIPEDRHKHGLVLDYTLEDNMVLQRYFEPEFTDKAGFLRRKNIRAYADRLIDLLTAMGQGFYTFVSIAPQEKLMQYFRVSLLAAVVVTVPVALYQVYAFAKPGLKKSETFFLKLVILLGLALFVVGVMFAYKLMMPFMLRFLSTGIEGADYIQTTTSIESYVSLCLTMFIIFGCVFEMPLVTIILSKMGIANPEILKKGRGVAIVLIFFIAAVVTPPDIVSQCMVAIPMVLLSLVSIFLSGIFYKPRSEDSDDEEEEEDED